MRISSGQASIVLGARPLLLKLVKPELVALIDKLAVAFAAKIREGIRDRFACKSNPNVGEFT